MADGEDENPSNRRKLSLSLKGKIKTFRFDISTHEEVLKAAEGVVSSIVLEAH